MVNREVRVMGYTHYWNWEEPVANAERFVQWSKDVQRLLEEYPSEPNRWVFEGKFPSPEHWSEKKICGMEGTGEPVVSSTEVAFNGDAHFGNDDEPFALNLKMLGEPNGFCWCKTGYSPYDLMVTAALVRLHHYFPAINISSDGEFSGFEAGTAFCRRVFGEATNPIDDAS